MSQLREVGTQHENMILDPPYYGVEKVANHSGLRSQFLETLYAKHHYTYAIRRRSLFRLPWGVSFMQTGKKFRRGETCSGVPRTASVEQQDREMAPALPLISPSPHHLHQSIAKPQSQ